MLRYEYQIKKIHGQKSNNQIDKQTKGKKNNKKHLICCCRCQKDFMLIFINICGN